MCIRDRSYVGDLDWGFVARQSGHIQWGEHMPDDPLRRERVLDFVQNRSVRHCLLRPGKHSPPEPPADLKDRIDDLFVICTPEKTDTPDGAPDNVQAYVSEFGVRMATPDARLIAMLDWLADQSESPTVSQIKETVSATTSLAGDNSLERELMGLVAGKFLQLSKAKPAMSCKIPERLAVSPFARHQLEAMDNLLTTLRHDVVQLQEADVMVAKKCNGTQTADSLAKTLDRPQEEIDASLVRLCRAGLLMASV